MSVNGLRGLVGVLAIGATLAVVSGCGSDSGNGSSSGSAASGSSATPGLSKAEALAKQATTRPTGIGIADPIGKPVPTGKKVAFISCGVEACEIQGNIIKQGASDLGWTASTIGTDGSPEQLQHAFDTALRQGADAVILNAVNRASVAKQIEKADAKGVPFVTCCSIETEGCGILRNVGGTANSAQIGEKLAAQIVADSNGKANTLFVNISAFQILKALGDQFSSSYKGYCPTCKYASLDIPATS